LNSERQYSGLLFTMIGPAGAGKNAVMNGVLEQHAEARQFPTATTRARRDYETQGREHQFLSRAEFEAMIAQQALLEHQEVHGNWYGIPRHPLENALAHGALLFADIDMHGATIVRQAFPHNAILVFVAPPSLPVLAQRMRERGESEAEISRRLLRAPAEMTYAPQCDYIIINDTLKQSIAEMMEIVAWERKRQNAHLRFRQSLVAEAASAHETLS
jgi:guanylate kinase